MVLYYQQRFESVQAGSRVIGVKCDHCGFDYYYELSRLGTGVGIAVYGLGQSSAETQSHEAAHKQLQEQLSSEAELVPCPKCHWINEELVRGYRRGQYRSLFFVGPVAAVVGIAISLVCAWFLSIGPAADRGGVPYFLIGGPVACVAWAVMVLLFRTWLRSRIQPNQNFPLEPNIPFGTPKALLLDEATGRLTVVDPTTSLRPSEEDDWMDLRLDRLAFVNACSECLQVPSPKSTYKLFVTEAIQLPVPRCSQCASRAASRERWIWLQVCAVLFLVGGLMYLLARTLFPRNADEVLICTAVGAVVTLIITGYAAAYAVAPASVGRLDAQRGFVRLKFRNRKFSELQRAASDAR